MSIGHQLHFFTSVIVIPSVCLGTVTCDGCHTPEAVVFENLRGNGSTANCTRASPVEQRPSADRAGAPRHRQAGQLESLAHAHAEGMTIGAAADIGTEIDVILLTQQES